MSNHRNHDNSLQLLLAEGRLRILLIGVVILAGFLAILIKLYWVQIEAGDELRTKISRQSIRRIRIPSKRGNIYTADLKLAAGNQLEYSVIFYPEEMRIGGRRTKTIEKMYEAAQQIARAIGRENKLTPEDINRHLNMRPGLPITVFKQLTMQEVARALEASRNLSGVDIAETESRSYPLGSFAAHLLGYTRYDSPQQAEDRSEFFYYLPDLVGKSGIEQAFDRLPELTNPPLTDSAEAPLGLRGLPGYSLVQVDHLGFVRESLIEKIEPRHGNHVILTIDSRAQALAESLMSEQPGAFVLVDADNGDILAAASTPAYDLRRFTPILPAAYYKELIDNPNRPLFNRALSGTYTPGSILKPLISLAFLNAGVDPEEPIVCDGGTKVGNANIRCASWRSGGHGSVNLRQALARSCNDYMIEHALPIGLDKIDDVLRSAGIGSATGLELHDKSGIFPARETKQRLYRTRWNNYDTALLSMGQGIITITPLQAAMFTAALANGGILYRPHLVTKVVDSFGNVLQQRSVEERNRLLATPEALQKVQAGMYDVVNTPTGSGRRAAVPGLEIHGKTGTAEVDSPQGRRQIVWFISFVRYQGKTYAAAIMQEDGHGGGRDCAPLAAEFYRRYLLPENP